MDCPKGHRIGIDWETKEDCGVCPFCTWSECSRQHKEQDREEHEDES